MIKLFANFFWIFTPTWFQKTVSRYFSLFFKTELSRLIILPYCLFYGIDEDYLSRFVSDSGDTTYKSYDDFFNRKYKSFPRAQSQMIWPCEGYVCDWKIVESGKSSFIKGDHYELGAVFDVPNDQIENHYFVNVFLHNHNYHRVHAPVDGEIVSIKRVPGGLVFLRPWFYKRQDVSYPAFKNERVIFEIKDKQNQTWYMAMIGGFGVGTIKYDDQLKEITKGQEIGRFHLGSTVCIASPYQINNLSYLQKVSVEQPLDV